MNPDYAAGKFVEDARRKDTLTYLCTSSSRQRSKFGKIAGTLWLQMLDDFV